MFVAVQLIVGLLALSAVLFPVLLRDRLMTYPLVVLGVGLLMPVVFPSVSFDLVEHVEVAEHLTEFAVIVALTGLGLSIDRPLSWRGGRRPGACWRSPCRSASSGRRCSAGG